MIERLSRMRMTTFSPRVVGSVLMRKSTFRFRTMARMRPSCGRRRSEMSRFAMIFRRDTRAGCIVCGGDMTSKRTPSMRYRIRIFFSPGSIWISLAPSMTALQIR